MSPAFELSAQASAAVREQYLRDTIFPQIEAEAAAGLEPSVDEIGFYHLNGWGTAVDLEKAESAFRLGLTLSKGHGAWRLGYVLWERAKRAEDIPAQEREALYRKAEELFVAAVSVGFKRAVPQMAYCAEGLMFGLYGREPGRGPDFEKAESLLETAAALDAMHPRLRYVRMELRILQHRLEEAFDLAGELLTVEKNWATETDRHSVGWWAAVHRVGCGILLRRTDALSSDVVWKALEHPDFHLSFIENSDPATLQHLESLAREHPRFLHQLALLRFKQRRFGEAFDYGERAASGLKEESRFREMYVESVLLRSLTAVLANRGMEGPAKDLKGLSQKELREWAHSHPLEFRKAVILSMWIIGFAGTMLVLCGVVLMFCKRSGLLRAIVCVGLAELALGIPLGLQSAFQHWERSGSSGTSNQAFLWGGLLGLSFAVLAAWSVDRSLFGSCRWRGGRLGALREGGVILAAMAGVSAFSVLYSVAFQKIMGRPLPAQDIISMLKFDSPGDLGVVFVTGALVIPWMEELIFRGLLWEPLEKKWGSAWALAITSGVFAVLHGWSFAAPTLVIGLLLGWLRMRHGGIGPSVGLHALNNAIAFAMTFSTKAASAASAGASL